MVQEMNPTQFVKTVWLTYFDNPVEMTMGDAAQELGVSRAKIRSAAQTLVQHGLLYPHAAGRVGLYKHDYYEDPNIAFEEAFPMDIDETPTSATPTGDQGTNCRCGCGSHVTGKKAQYAPGHDARHAGNIGRAIAGNPDMEVALLGELPTEALRLKAQRVAQKAAAKAGKKAIRAGRKPVTKTSTPSPTEPVFTEGAVKVGRWTYPARAYEDGSVVRNSKRDGSGQWVDHEGLMD